MRNHSFSSHAPRTCRFIVGSADQKVIINSAVFHMLFLWSLTYMTIQKSTAHFKYIYLKTSQNYRYAVARCHVLWNIAKQHCDWHLSLVGCSSTLNILYIYISRCELGKSRVSKCDHATIWVSIRYRYICEWDSISEHAFTCYMHTKKATQPWINS